MDDDTPFQHIPPTTLKDEVNFQAFFEPFPLALLCVMLIMIWRMLVHKLVPLKLIRTSER